MVEAVETLTRDLDRKLNLTGVVPKLDLASDDDPIPPGLELAFTSVSELLEYPIKYAHLFELMNIACPRGVLLHGPPGVGKTLLVKTLCARFGARWVSVSGPDIFSPFPGESEAQLRRKFKEARELARRRDRPCILFIDELDALAPTRRAHSSPVEAGVVAQLLTLMDGLAQKGEASEERLVVIAATNRPNAIDPALRRPGRFDREVAMDVPDAEARGRILRFCTRKLREKGRLAPALDLEGLASATAGYVGADLALLCREAMLLALASGSSQVAQGHFAMALAKVSPSLRRHESAVVLRGGSAVAGLEEVKRQLRKAVEWPLRFPTQFKRMGLRPPRGILLYGPPGCSKTSLVKLFSANLAMFTLHGASVYSCYVGESEAIVRAAFERARRAAPALLFIDEIDALVGSRSFDLGSKGDPVQERILTTVLNEMDGVQEAGQVLVVGATNRPDCLDAALLRPGRFDRQIYVPPPGLEARKEILALYTASLPVDADVDLDAIARSTKNFSGADLQNLCREASLLALRDANLDVDLDPNLEAPLNRCLVKNVHFTRALNATSPSLTPEMFKAYEAFNAR
ncbi:hypothetical protein L0F63_002792 [Massospora cicadina]|nr:hypothetical protein L0F63_002792 [Massospora cicadina]